MRVLASGRQGRGGHSQPQLAAIARYEQEVQTTYVVSSRARTPLSGRAIVYVAPYNVGPNVCIGENHAALAICSPASRGAAKRGAVIITVTPACKRTGTCYCKLIGYAL